MDRINKKLARIEKASFGHGGYQDAEIGISFTFGSEGWGIGDFWGFWGTKRAGNAKWTEQDRIDTLGSVVMRINQLLSDARVRDVESLVGVPVEITINGGRMVSWRVLKEVL